ncbi:MAG: DUF2167 domain-containing protein [Methylovirgula sp.]
MKAYSSFIRLALVVFATTYAILAAADLAWSFQKPAVGQNRQPWLEAQVPETRPPQAEEPPTGSSNADSNPTIRALRALNWKFAPQVGNIGDEATIALSPDVALLGAADTNRFLELNKDLPCNQVNCYALVAQSLRWFAIFSFDPTGYVKDDERIDADALLKILKEQNSVALEQKRQRGLPLLYLDGWYIPPHYDTLTKRLEWGTRIRGENGAIAVNYAIRLLGRDGVMSAVLVSDPGSLNADLKSFKLALQNFTFNGGKTYAEFREGDKVSEYGLTALIVGGAAAAAAKTGVGKGLFAAGAGLIKALAFGVLAFLASIWKFIKGLFSKKNPS